jgi:adenylate kinase family enzyme
MVETLPPEGRARRIAVLGRAGSGKSTVAVALGTTLGLRVVHLDQLYWSSDWRPVASERFEALHLAAIAADAWILDGGYTASPSFADRLRRADLVVITEASLARCLYRVVRRTIRYRGRLRTGGPDGADEQFSLTFLIWIVRWTWKHRDLAGEIAAIDPDVRIAVVRRPGDLERAIAA